MKLHRFIINAALSSSIRIRDKEVANQIQNVLRLKEGDRLIVCDGSMHEAEAIVTSLGKDTVEISLGEIRRNTAEASRKVIVYLSILKGEHFDMALEKATECGVSEIVPLITERTVKQGVREERAQKILKEAAEQSGRGKVPLLHAQRSLQDAVMHAELANTTNFFYHETGEPLDMLRSVIAPEDSIGIFVGPEGGWSAPEILFMERQLMDGKNFKIVTLGKRTLRAETAAVVGTYSAVNL